MQTVDKAETTWGGPRLARKVQNVSPQCTWIPGGGPGAASQRGGAEGAGSKDKGWRGGRPSPGQEVRTAPYLGILKE